jgi:hypothetical protein
MNRGLCNRRRLTFDVDRSGILLSSNLERLYENGARSVSCREEIGEGAGKRTRKEPLWEEKACLDFLISQKPAPKWVCRGLADLSTISHGSTHSSTLEKGTPEEAIQDEGFSFAPIVSRVATTGQPSWQRYVSSRTVISSASYQKGKDKDEGAQRPGRLPDSLAHFRTKKGT